MKLVPVLGELVILPAHRLARVAEGILVAQKISEASGKSLEEVSRDIERDKFLTADQANEYGLIDDVLQTLKTPVPAGV